MKKFIFAIPLIAITCLSSLTLSTSVHAVQEIDEDSAVSTNFKDVARTMRKLRRAKTGKDVAKNLEKIKKLTVKNSNLMPSFAPQGSAELKTYKTEVDKMIEGIDTNIPLHIDLVSDAAFRAGGTDIHYLERRLGHS